MKKFNIPSDIVEAAVDARKRLLSCMAADSYTSPDMRTDVTGKCHEGSEILYDKLRNLGYDPALVGGWFVWGRKRRDHTWLEVDGHIIDITADQFDKKFPIVWIDPPKKHYKVRHEYFFED